MKAYLVCISDFYYQNRIFDIASPYNRDDSFYPFYLMKKRFADSGCDLNTYDYLTAEDEKHLDFKLIFSDIPKNIDYFMKRYPTIPKYLLINESEIILPDNWNLNLHQKFKKIFTWHDNFIDNKKYFKTNFSNRFPDSIPKNISEKTELCTLIAFNKKLNHPLELYSKRMEAIRWFEEHHPEDFDFFGIGWDEYTFGGPRIIRMLNRVRFLKKMLAPKYSTYRGRVERKFDTLRKYRFSICYENVRDLPGWVTEKIFDCFFAGCVPIYWGAGNVTAHIPENCFIDRRTFNTYEELYEFIKKMDDNTYLRYLDNIESFLKSPKAYQYSAEYFAETITREVINE